MPANTRLLHIIISSYPLRGFLDLAAFVLTPSVRSLVMYKWDGYEANYPKPFTPNMPSWIRMTVPRLISGCPGPGSGGE